MIGCLVAFYQNRWRLLDWYTELLAASPTQTIVVDRLGARRTVVTANPANVEQWVKWLDQPLDQQLLAEVQEILRTIHNWFYIEGRPENNDRAA